MLISAIVLFKQKAYVVSRARARMLNKKTRVKLGAKNVETLCWEGSYDGCTPALACRNVERLQIDGTQLSSIIDSEQIKFESFNMFFVFPRCWFELRLKNAQLRVAEQVGARNYQSAQ